DLERSARGLRLNRFLHGLANGEKRTLFVKDPEKAMQKLSEQEKDLVRALDWREMLDCGASFFCLEKLARAKGVSNPEMVAAFRGETLEQFLKTRRVPGARGHERNRSAQHPPRRRRRDRKPWPPGRSHRARSAGPHRAD